METGQTLNEAWKQMVIDRLAALEALAVRSTTMMATIHAELQRVTGKPMQEDSDARTR